MKRILYPLLAATFALSLLLPVSIVWAGPVAAVCSVHANTPCSVKDGDSYCSWTENVPQNKLSRAGRGGQPQWVIVQTPQLQIHKCAAWEHPKAE